MVDCIFFFSFFLQQNIQDTKNYGFSPTFDSIIQLQVHIKRKEKPKPRVAPPAPSLGRGWERSRGGGGGCSVAACRDRVFGKNPNPILPNLYIYMQVLDAGKGSICNPSLRAVPTDGPLSADCSVVIGQNWFNTPRSKLGGNGKKSKTQNRHSISERNKKSLSPFLSWGSSENQSVKRKRKKNEEKKKKKTALGKKKIKEKRKKNNKRAKESTQHFGQDRDLCDWENLLFSFSLFVLSCFVSLSLILSPGPTV